ncbi:Rhs element Vgr protein [Pseudomonas fluorescens]|uniref:Rhs element Vgr protein n=1 Tax=Pseudomonas fluorescens TaxID=294 RepID=A0A379IGS9_PSEFL|nr:type VI secretion system tip protein TssI/VgrG [Pseudomonas fluorescens]AIG02146.1 type VI secretion protein VgrG [Pseudomonas fluorescens]SUD32603.1 Rhs element Vgr protein [Pseudomonas fluorescens]
MPGQSDLRYTFEPLKGDAFDVVSFKFEEGLSQPFKLELELASHNAAIDFNRVLDLPGLFTIWRGEAPVRYVHGLVSLLTQGDTGFRRTRYSAVVEPTLARFELRSNWRIFQGQSVPNIILEVLKDQRLTDVKTYLCFDHQSREYCVQAGETDLDFIARLAAEEGLLYTFEHRADGHTLWFTDRVGGLGTIGTHEHCPVIYQPMGGGDSMEPALHRFYYTEQVRTAVQVQRDYTFTHPCYRQQHTATGDQDLNNQHKDYERYDYPGRYKRDVAGKPFTKTRLSALRSDAKMAHLAGDDARLQPGLAFDVSDHPRDDFNDRWRTIAIEHEGKQHTCLEEEAFGSITGTSYELKATAIRWTSDWKAPLRDKPCIDGPQVATVVGPAGEEIYCDKWGRVKVSFPWDRSDKHNDHSSCWIRVAQGWAGATWGSMAIPRVGQELIISYLDGDPDQPIATGRAYRETNLPPYELPKHKTRTTIKSQTHMGEGFNELRFEDEQGQQEVYIHAEKDKNVHIKHNNGIFVGHDRSEKVGHDENIEIGHDRSERVGNDERIEVVQDCFQTLGRDHRSNIGRDRVEAVGNNRYDKVAADHDIRIGGSVEHCIKSHYRLATGEGIAQKTTEFEVEAGQRIVLKAPGGSITIDSDGITLDGLTIKIQGPVTADGMGTGNPFSSLLRSPTPPAGDFLGRYTLLKSDQRAFSGYRYRITDGTAVLVEGLTHSSGETDWAMTQTTHAVQVHKVIMREDQRVTETWRPSVAFIEEQAVAHDDAGLFPDDFLDQYMGDLD